MDLLNNIENSLIFQPTKDIYCLPEDEGISYEEVFINTPDGEKLHGFYLPYEKEKTDKVMLYLHGNAQNVTAWYQACTEIQKQVTVNALIVDYRGYGRSTGSPSPEKVVVDAISMYDFLISKGFKSENISVYGRSIGGAIGVELANKRKLKSLVVQSSFTSLKEIAKELFPFLPSQLIIKENVWNSKQFIKSINAPVLISHGSNDEVVLVSHSYKLFEMANEPKKLIILKGAGHNDISDYFTEDYFFTLRSLLS